jgi:putative addiction module component (TIGR02574 family)
VSPTTISVFDLSPAEKLQLIEDLWDDLAATPKAVPVHDWHKEELARRKANLRQHPASCLTWEDVQRRVRSRYGRCVHRCAEAEKGFNCDTIRAGGRP